MYNGDIANQGHQQSHCLPSIPPLILVLLCILSKTQCSSGSTIHKMWKILLLRAYTSIPVAPERQSMCPRLYWISKATTGDLQHHTIIHQTWTKLPSHTLPNTKQPLQKDSKTVKAKKLIVKSKSWCANCLAGWSKDWTLCCVCQWVHSLGKALQWNKKQPKQVSASQHLLPLQPKGRDELHSNDQVDWQCLVSVY